MHVKSNYTIRLNAIVTRVHWTWEISWKRQVSSRGKVKRTRNATCEDERKKLQKFAWLTLTVGVRDRDNDRQQQRQKHQHQFAPHRCIAAATTTAVDGDDASRIGAPGIARHVPETRTPLAGWTRWPRLTRTSWQHGASSRHGARSSHVGCLASVARARTHHTHVTDHPSPTGSELRLLRTRRPLRHLWSWPTASFPPLWRRRVTARRKRPSARDRERAVTHGIQTPIRQYVLFL